MLLLQCKFTDQISQARSTVYVELQSTINIDLEPNFSGASGLSFSFLVWHYTFTGVYMYAVLDIFLLFSPAVYQMELGSRCNRNTKTFRSCKELPTNYPVPGMLMAALYALAMDYTQTVM